MNWVRWAWREGSAVRGAYCSCRAQGFKGLPLQFQGSGGLLFCLRACGVHQLVQAKACTEKKNTKWPGVGKHASIPALRSRVIRSSKSSPRVASGTSLVYMSSCLKEGQGEEDMGKAWCLRKIQVLRAETENTLRIWRDCLAD